MSKNLYSIEEIKKKINEFSEFDDSKGAFLFFQEVENFIKSEKIKETKPDIFKEYEKLVVKLKFLSLNFFGWDEVFSLVKNHFETVFQIKYYNLWSKIKILLMSEPIIGERDKIKNALKGILLNCETIIINKEKYIKFQNFPLSVSDWLKDYTINLGVKEFDNLKKAQYLISGKNIKELDEGDINKIKELFNIYERLKLSSQTPQGFENDVPMVINGKLVIFKNGEVEEVDNNVSDLIKSIKTDEDELDYKAELEQLASQYQEGSLERRAIEEEIKKQGGNV